MKNISNFKPTRLYIKRILRDDNTYIYYFGKTVVQNIEKYAGSGTQWRKFIKKYGKDCVEHCWHSDWFYSAEDISAEAEKFSTDNNIVESSQWANLEIENGLDGGFCLTDEHKNKISATLKAKGKTTVIQNGGTHNRIWINNTVSETCIKQCDAIPEGWRRGRLKGRRNTVTVSQPKVQCPKCGRIGGKNAMTRLHFNKCKY